MAGRASPLVSSGGSVVRRRERRLRSFWRHEQMAIQMALAAVTHHSFQVGTAHDALRSQKVVTSAGGRRPPPLVEVRPSVRAQRHVVEHLLGDLAPMVQVIDAPVPQTVDDVLGFCRLMDLPVAEQAIKVPFFSSSSCSSRVVPVVPQMAEQLVEVPTPFYIFEQNVDNPAPRVGGSGSGGLHGFLAGQSSPSAADKTVDTPVRGRGVSRGLQGFHKGEGLKWTVEQIVDTPVSSASLHGSRPDLGSTAVWQAEHHGFSQNRVPLRFLDKIFREDLLEVFKILSRDRVQLVLAVVKTLVELFKTLSEDRVQQRLAEMVVVMLTLVLWLNGPRSSCGCGRTVLFSWCWPSGMRRCVTSSASSAATWVSMQRKSLSSSSAISFHPTTLQPRPGSRKTTSSMLCCREEEEEDEDVGRSKGLGIPSPHLGCHGFIPAYMAILLWPRSSSTVAVTCSWLVLLVSFLQ